MSRIRLTPLMESTLRAMERGPLDWTPTGWRSTVGLPGVWNTHTLHYLARWRGLCCLRRQDRATITDEGRRELTGWEWAA